MGTGGLVPHRSPSRSPNVPQKPPSNEASHRRAKGRCGQPRSSQAGQGRSSGSGEEDPSEPRPAQRCGRLVSAGHREGRGTQRRPRRGHTCGPRSQLRRDARPPTATAAARRPHDSGARRLSAAAQAALPARPFSPLTRTPTPGGAGPAPRPRASAEGRELRVPGSRGRATPASGAVPGPARSCAGGDGAAPAKWSSISQLVPSGYPHMWHCF